MRRLRSHVRQKGSVVDEMMPNVWPSGSRKRSAGADVASSRAVAGPRASPMVRSISARLTTSRADQRVAPPTSMYSMKRTSASTGPRVGQQVDELVVVHTPRMTTVSSFRFVNPDPVAARDARPDRGQRVEAREVAEAVGAQRVEADGQAVQPGGPERRRLVREQHAVRGEREVLEGRPAGEQADQVRQVRAQERLSPP